MIASTVSSAYLPTVFQRRAASALIRDPPLEEPDLGEREEQREEEQCDREHRGLPGIVAERLEDEVREDVRLAERAALGEQVDLAERLEREDRPDDHGEEDRRREHGQRDVPEARPRARAVDARGLVQLV